MNALGGCITRAASPGSLKFQRTVVVTKIYCAKETTPATALIYLAARMASTGTAAMTAFASITISTTSTIYCVNKYKAMTQASNKTFLAADVLGISVKTADRTAGGIANFIVRYKEK
jgi:hypothetical protein